MPHFTPENNRLPHFSRNAGRFFASYAGALLFVASFSSCLSLDPDFIPPYTVGSDSSEIHSEETIGENLDTGTTTNGDMDTEGSTDSGSESTTTGEENDSLPDDFGGTDTDNSTNGGEVGEESTSSTVGESETGVSAETSGDETTSGSTTSDVPSTEGTDATSGDTGTSTSDTTSGDTSSDTMAETSGDSSSDTSDTGSEDTGTEPCVPQLCMSANTSSSLHPQLWVYGSYLYAFRFRSTKSQFVFRAEIATGEASGSGTVAIWSDSGNGQQPGSRLDSGSWQMVQQNSWQGADFTSPVAVFGDQYYWLVWELPYRAQAPIGQSGSYTTYRWSTNNGNTWSSDSPRGMYRMYCCDTNQ